ncbi:peroxisomal multifunctional enzyme type 2-like [Tubulanus polymorphus]|uniref:peroxisomal multifunctional enzyme type 2-like n=1 Tax=Tubulanus polymorphus TaxID=672921 RepID=UPI003DA5831A
MSEDLRFDEKVVLVTGAGGGLGRQYALAFGKRGALVVVNDLGGDIKGGGKSSRPADLVVDEIKSEGGKAIANYDSVEDGAKIIDSVVKAFGKIDVIVNNAGILRDKSFSKTTDADWDIVHRVHLRGSFQVTRAAWELMKKQKYGRLIMTSSAAGVYGNFGQANYSSAKLGLLGLSNTLAIEGAKYNIHCNTIVPTAGSRLTETVFPPDLVEALKPEYVAPLVLYLCHESCPETGAVFEVGGGYIAKLRWEQTKGAIVRKKGIRMTPESVRDNWEKITDFADSRHSSTIQEATSEAIQAIGIINSSDDQEETALPNNDNDLDMQSAIGYTSPPQMYTFTHEDVILYALGVGVSMKEAENLKFLYEGLESFCALPTYSVIPAQEGLKYILSGNVPGLEIDPSKVLHGEQYIEMYKPFPTSGTVKNVYTICDILDKGSGALVIIDVDTYDDGGVKLCCNQFAIFVVGAGNFGGKRTSTKQKMTAGKPPSRSPDASITEKTSIDQAALYRLSGDFNPLHIDANFAAMAGFPQPILHGLSSFGYSTRHILKQYAGNDVTKLKAVKARFAKPVLPGQTLQTDMWKDSNRIYFQTKVIENGNICLSGAYVDLISTTEIEKPTEFKKMTNLQSDAVFAELKEKLVLEPNLVKKIKVIYQWNITKEGKAAATWTVDLKNGNGDIYSGVPKTGKPGCTLTVDDENLVQMFSGKLNPQQAFMKGLLKITGNIMLSQKLGQLFKDRAKL